MKTAAHIQSRSNPVSGNRRNFFAVQQGNDSFFTNKAVHPKHFEGIQAKLSVGQPGDKYEVEADAMADQVVQGLQSEQTPDPPFFNTTNTLTAVQPKCTECPEEEVQKKEEELQEEEVVQTRSFASDAGGSEEDVQLKCESCESDIQAKGEETHPEPAIESQLSSSKGSGRPLSNDTKEAMEVGMGTDFSDVNIHTGSQAVQMSEQLNAQAFTHGSDIYFNQGKYEPSSTEGQHLLAHELTHTVQQGASLNKKSIQKSEEEPGAGASVGSEATGLISNSNNTITYASLPVTRFKTTGGREILYQQFRLKRKNNYSGSREEKGIKQRDIWRAGVDTKNIEHILNKKMSKANGLEESKSGSHRIYAFKVNGKSQKGNCYLTGTMQNILKEATIPKWNNLGQCPKYFQVDHIVEMQISGFPESEKVNTIDNLELLEATANLRSGKIIRSSVESKVRQTLQNDESRVAMENKIPQLSSTGEMEDKIKLIKNKYDLIFNDFVGKGGPMVKPNKYWIRSQIEMGDHLSHISPVNMSELGTEDKILVFPRRYHPVGKNFKWNGKDQSPTRNEKNWFSPWVITNKFFITNSPESETLGHLTLGFPQEHSTVRAEGGVVEIKKLPGAQFAGYVDNVEGSSGGKKSIINAGKFAIKHLSPVRFDQITFQDDSLKIIGKVLPTLDIIKNTELDLLIEKGDVMVSKTFSNESLNLPSPFEIQQTSLSLFISSKKGLSVDGRVDFGIKGLGDGFVSGVRSGHGGFQLKGVFNFDSKLFDPAEVSMGYKDNIWSMGGKIGIPKGKVKGLKKAEAEVHYENGHLSAKGMAQPDIKGFDQIEMFLDIQKDGYSFGGKINLAGVPMVESGELELTVAQNAATNGLEISGGGTVVPDIPGLKSGSDITIIYKDGAILMQGEVPYSFAKLNAEGKVLVGITNQVVNDNNEPTGIISDNWKVFGKGNVKIILGKGIEASAAIKLEPNGDLIISGNVKLDHSEDKASSKEIELLDKELFKIGPISTIIFTIPPLGASLRVGIEGGARIFAFITPPHFKELSIGLDDFNLTNPTDNFEIEGNVSIGTSGRAGLSANLTLEAKLTVGAVAKVKGELKGSIGMYANAQADANVKAKWSKANGFEIEEGKLCICADARFMAELTGSIRVYLDLWLAEIDIWNENLDIASIEFGKTMKIGFALPINMKNGELSVGTLDQNDLDVPDISSPQKQQEMVTDAVNQDDKVKPPPPPSKEEAIKAVRILDSGPINGWDILTMDADEAKARVAWNLITRDTYILWLRTKHKKIDWSQAIAVGRQKDRIEFDRFKANFLAQDLDIFEKMRKIGSFKKNHHLFTDANGSELVKLFKEKKKSPSITNEEAEPLEY